MKVGVPTETAERERRVALVPDVVKRLAAKDHEVIVQSGAGAGIFADDAAYEKAGARIVKTADEVFFDAQMIVKVKEPQPQEIGRLRQGQVLFTYLHLAADRAQTEGLLRSGAICIAYETVTSRSGALPLLKPMSEVAGRMSVHVGAHYLEKEPGGRGVLLGEKPAVPRISDLGNLPTSALGKLELDLMGTHQMGEKQVLEAIVADYLGQVWGGEVFDGSFDGDPAAFSIGTGSVIQGWD